MSCVGFLFLYPVVLPKHIIITNWTQWTSIGLLLFVVFKEDMALGERCVRGARGVYRTINILDCFLTLSPIMFTKELYNCIQEHNVEKSHLVLAKFMESVLDHVRSFPRTHVSCVSWTICKTILWLWFFVNILSSTSKVIFFFHPFIFTYFNTLNLGC